jgi:CheY-like chemotaxis protein
MQIKILVVDDSAADRLIIKNMLREYCILTACDGGIPIKSRKRNNAGSFLYCRG